MQVFVGLLCLAVFPACEPPASDANSGTERTRGVPSEVPRFDRVLGPFLAEHWRPPIAPQGEPPASFSEPERSLDPQICGACHPKQLAEWKTSFHAHAFSPGFSGQLIDGSLANPTDIRSCQSCHAPLAEQQPFTVDGRVQPILDPKLRAHGVVCAVCHIRRHRYFGPPRRPGIAIPSAPVPHGGFQARPEYLESRFCSPCHQFFDDSGANGKPIENTFVEWQNSPQAAAGRSCQSCHMPDRVHHWRGIHDPELVRAAIDVDLFPLDLSGRSLRAALVLRNRDVGHAFPTYVTPRVYLAVFQIDTNGTELADTRQDATIGRQVDLSTMTEEFDTRVLPGASVKLDYTGPRKRQAIALLGRVTIDPDFHYRGVFEYLLGTLQNKAARARIEQARQQISASTYVLAEIRRPLP